jgi:hypothetical protein
MSTNPESFAFYGNAIYFTDVRRAVVCRLDINGIIEISELGMDDFFEDSFRSLLTGKKIGAFDLYNKQYVLSTAQDPTKTIRLFTGSSSSSSVGACASSAGEDTLFYIGSGGELENGDVVYTNSAGTTPFNGASNFWRVQNNDLSGFFAVRISTLGNTSDKTACIPPTKTMRLFTGSASFTSAGACGSSLAPDTLYYIGSGDNLEDGDVVYTDSAGTTLFVGNDRFWSVQNNDDPTAFFAIRIAAQGNTSDKIGCP